MPGRPASPPSFRFLVLEAPRPAAPTRCFRRPRDVILVGDCVEETWAASPTLPSISSSPIRPIIFNSKARCRAPTRASSTRSTTTGTNSPAFANYDRFTRDWLAAVAARDEARRDDRRHRLLSQHLPRRRDPAGSGLLDSQRHRLAQGQSDAEFSRPPLHQRARDDDLGGALGRAKGYTLQLRGAEGRQRGLSGPLRLVFPICTGARAAEGRRGAQDASDAEARGAARPRCCSRPPTPAISCSIRSSAPAPPAPSPDASAAISSASSAIRLRGGRARANRRGRAAARRGAVADADQALGAARRLRQP